MSEKEREKERGEEKSEGSREVYGYALRSLKGCDFLLGCRQNFVRIALAGLSDKPASKKEENEWREIMREGWRGKERERVDREGEREGWT